MTTPALPGDSKYNPVPGADTLGRAFSVFDRWQTPNRPQLFDMCLTADGPTYDFGGIRYALPTNVASPTPVSQGTTAFQYFSSAEDFSQYFMAKAGIKGSYRAFTGEFNAQYSDNVEFQRENQYFLVHTEYAGYQLTLESALSAKLSPAVTSDSLYQNLPVTCTDANQMAFFNFFDRYGTHYISAVTVGARCYYTSQMAKSYQSTDQQAKANLTVAFESMFSSGSANVETEWKRVDKQWFQNQQGRVEFVGGDNSLLGIVVPQFGDDFSAKYQQWIGSLTMNPVPRDFVLRPIYDLVPAEKLQAVKDAIDRYTNAVIVVHADGGNTATACSATISLRGNSVTAKPTATGGGLLYAVYDRQSLALQASGTCDVQAGRQNQKAEGSWQDEAIAAYKPATDVLLPYAGRSDVIVALIFFGVNSLYSYPPPQFQGLMRGITDGGLGSWSNHHASGTATQMAYALVGIPEGRSEGEDLMVWGKVTVYPGEGPFPDLDLEVFLEPDELHEKFQFTPA